MEKEIVIEWMGDVLKALLVWFNPPRDLSDLPDHRPILVTTVPAGTTFEADMTWVEVPPDETMWIRADGLRQPVYDNQTIAPFNPNTPTVFLQNGRLTAVNPTPIPQTITVYATTVAANTTFNMTTYAEGVLEAAL